VRIGRKKEVREKRLLSADDMRRLLAVLPAGSVRFIVLIIFGTGLRVSEVLGLRWRNIDLDAGTLKVEQRWYRGDLDDPKTEGSVRTRQLGPLTDEFRRAYQGPQARDKFVFVGDDGVAPPDERDLLRYGLRPAAAARLILSRFWLACIFAGRTSLGANRLGATPRGTEECGAREADTTFLHADGC
jgi:integrase